MSDLISRSAVLEMFAKYKFGAINNDVERECIKETIPLLVNSIPTVEAIPKEKLMEIIEKLEQIKECAWDEEYQTMCDVVEIVKGVMNE